jgi:hypothetical protein
MLADPNADPRAIAALVAILPKPTAAPNEYPPEHFELLTDEEFAELDRLTGIVTVGKRGDDHRVMTHARNTAHGLVEALSALELRGCAPYSRHDRQLPTPAEIIEVKNLLNVLLLNAGLSLSDVGIAAEREVGLQAKLCWIAPGDVVIPACERRYFALPALLPPGMEYLPLADDGILRAGVIEKVAPAVPAAAIAPTVEAAGNKAEPPSNVVIFGTNGTRGSW